MSPGDGQFFLSIFFDNERIFGAGSSGFPRQEPPIANVGIHAVSRKNRQSGREARDVLSEASGAERKLYNNCGSTRNFGGPRTSLATNDSVSLVKSFKTTPDDANYASASAAREE